MGTAKPQTTQVLIHFKILHISLFKLSDLQTILDQCSKCCPIFDVQKSRYNGTQYNSVSA